MKKILLSVAFIAAVFTTQAQNPDGVGFGPHIGMNLSNIANGEFSTFDKATDNINVGGIVGIAINIPIGNIVSIQPEFLFAQKGGRLTETSGLFKDSYIAFVNNYMEIPLLVKARIGGKVYGFLQGGVHWFLA